MDRHGPRWRNLASSKSGKYGDLPVGRAAERHKSQTPIPKREGLAILSRPTKKKMLIRIESSYFVAGIVREAGKACRIAPILEWMAGMKLQAILKYCKKKGFKVTIME